MKITAKNTKTIDCLTYSEKTAIFQIFNGQPIVSPQDIINAIVEHHEQYNGYIDGFFTDDVKYSFESLYEKIKDFTFPELEKLAIEIVEFWAPKYPNVKRNIVIEPK